jgi:hypothetical protein
MTGVSTDKSIPEFEKTAQEAGQTIRLNLRFKLC